MSLGERLTAARDANQAIAQCAADDACSKAQKYAEALRDAIKTYVDNQITSARSAAKTYVDNQIAKLVAANNLNPPQ